MLASPSAPLSGERSDGGWWLAPLPLLGAALLALGGAWLVMGSRSDRLAYAAAGAAGASRRRESWWTPKAAAETVAIAAVAFAAIVALQSFVIRPVLIPSASMAPTLSIGNQVVMERVTDRARAPVRGDIVVFNPPAGATEQRCGVPRPIGQACPRPTAGKADSHYIKRVVAAPGDRLQIIGSRVYIDSRLQREPYAKTTVNCGECNLPKDITIPPGHYFLMGDNRADSIDSRVWGPVRQDHIIGRAIFRFWPPPRIGPL